MNARERAMELLFASPEPVVRTAAAVILETPIFVDLLLEQSMDHAIWTAAVIR